MEIESAERIGQVSKNAINAETGTFMLSSYRPPDIGSDIVAGSVYRPAK